MNPNEQYKNDPELWKILCYRFIGRSRRLANFEKMKVPQFLIDEDKKLVQQAYEQMREACLNDEEYMSSLWETK